MAVYLSISDYAAMRKYYIEARANSHWSDNTLDMLANTTISKLTREKDSAEAVWEALKEQTK